MQAMAEKEHEQVRCRKAAFDMFEKACCDCPPCRREVEKLKASSCSIIAQCLLSKGHLRAAGREARLALRYDARHARPWSWARSNRAWGGTMLP